MVVRIIIDVMIVSLFMDVRRIGVMDIVMRWNRMGVVLMDERLTHINTHNNTIFQRSITFVGNIFLGSDVTQNEQVCHASVLQKKNSTTTLFGFATNSTDT